MGGKVQVWERIGKEPGKKSLLGWGDLVVGGDES